MDFWTGFAIGIVLGIGIMFILNWRETRLVRELREKLKMADGAFLRLWQKYEQLRSGQSIAVDDFIDNHVKKINQIS